MEELFEQIVHSEKAAKERNSLIKELKLNIQNEEEKNRQLQTDGLQLRKQLEQKVTELSDKQLKSKWLSRQEKIYKDQKNELEHQLTELKKREVELQQRLDAKRLQFCDVCDAFSGDFGLVGSGATRREQSCSMQLTEFLKKQAELAQRQQAYTKHQQCVDKLKEEMITLEEQLVDVMEEADKQTASLCEELEKTASLEKEWLTLTHKPQTDTEFISFQSQLEEERTRASTLEDRCRCLQDELRQLQQACWHKKVQTQQRQKQHQQNRAKSQSSCMVPPARPSQTMETNEESGPGCSTYTADSVYSKTRDYGGTGSLTEAIKETLSVHQSMEMEPDILGEDQSVEPAKYTGDQGSHRKYIFKYKTSGADNGN